MKLKTNNKELNSLAQISPLISVPLLNNTLDTLKSSTVDSLVEQNLQRKEIEKETKKGFIFRSERSININNKIINFLQNENNKASFKEKLLTLKTNTVQSSPIKNDIASADNKVKADIFYIEDILKLIISHKSFTKNNKKLAKVILKKLNSLKKSKRIRNKTPILSFYLNKILNGMRSTEHLANHQTESQVSSSNGLGPISSLASAAVALEKIINKDQLKQSEGVAIRSDSPRLRAKRVSDHSNAILGNNILINKKKFIEYNFKVKYVNPIEEYKNRNSLLYKSLPIEDKKLINNLLFIESKILNNTGPASQAALKENKRLLILTKQSLIRNITPFDSSLLYSKNIMYNFNKRNSYNIFKNETNILSILESAFLSMNSLISKAIFSVKPKNVLINLFFFWKPPVNKNRGALRIFNPSPALKYSKIFSKFAVIYEKNLKNLSFTLSKILKKPVHFQFTRLYYPYNDSNIFACFIGYMSFFIKFTYMSKFFLNKINFFITKRRYFRLKYRYIPSVVNGINIKLGGRILTARTKRKVKSKKVQWGTLARTNNNLTTFSRFTNKNKTGAFSITVKNNTFVLT